MLIIITVMNALHSMFLTAKHLTQNPFHLKLNQQTSQLEIRERPDKLFITPCMRCECRPKIESWLIKPKTVRQMYKFIKL